MSSDDTPAKSSPTKSESTSKAASTPTETATKAEGSAKAESGAPANYSRGEGQKAVTQAYRDNWNVIFGDKPKLARSKTASRQKPKAKKSKRS